VELYCISGNSGELHPKYDLNTIQKVLWPVTYSIKENNIFKVKVKQSRYRPRVAQRVPAS
jgi:hypothetical protein